MEGSPVRAPEEAPHCVKSLGVEPLGRKERTRLKPGEEEPECSEEAVLRLPARLLGLLLHQPRAGTLRRE